jgi:hypothetical protein
MDATNASQINPVNRAHDIVAAASYDEEYRFGRKPNTRAPFPFTEREFARLLIVRSRIQAERSSLSADPDAAA